MLAILHIPRPVGQKRSAQEELHLLDCRVPLVQVLLWPTVEAAPRAASRHQRVRLQEEMEVAAAAVEEEEEWREEEEQQLFSEV